MHRRRLWIFTAAAATAVLAGAVDYPSRPREQDISAHDPAVLKDGNYYYVYGTHNMPVWRSRDLVEFERVERRLVGRLPEEAAEHVGEGGRTLWAPDIVKVDRNRYRLYYCLSRFGSSQSYIGFLEGRSPTGTFKDGAEVTRSVDPRGDREAPNALDPSILVDDDGKQWMVYGSFFGGIYIMRLDEDGAARSSGSPGKRVAARSGRNEMEGPCILYNPDLQEYFLFVSYDELSSTYNVRVGRSKDPGGPYRDFKGTRMEEPEDNIPKILNSYVFENHSGWHGPGHNSVLRDGDSYFMLHHAREEINGRKIVHTHVRKMVFTDEGWPVVSPERYAGEVEQPIPDKEMIGAWEVLFIDPEDNGMQRARTGLVFEKDGTLRFGEETGTWNLMQPDSLNFKLGSRKAVSAKVLPAWDWENDDEALVFTGLDENGVAVWGKLRD